MPAFVSARQHSTALLLATWDRVGAHRTWLNIEIGQSGLPARTILDHVHRSWAMRRRSILRMARFFTSMDAAIQRSLAHVATVKASSPVHTLLLLLLVVALDLLFDLAAVASGIDLHGTSTAKTFMTGPLTCMISTRHHIPADRATAPTCLIVRFNTTSSRFLFPTKTALGRSHR